MANSAFDHSPTITVPGASGSTNDAVVRWDGTGGSTFQNSVLIVSDAGVVTGVTSLTVDNLLINGNTISSTAGTDLLITPLAGQQLILDGTIIIDAGVVTGATSITSTEFHGGGGNLTGISAGISFSGSTTNGVVTYGSSSSAVVESTLTFNGATGALTVVAANSSTRLNFDSYQDTTDGGAIQFRHSRHDTLGSHTALVSGDDLGKIRFMGSGGSAFSIGAVIQAKATETFSTGSSNYGTKLEFYTTDNTSDINDLRMTIDHDGEITVKENTSMTSVTKGIAKTWCRIDTDGTLIAGSYNIATIGDDGTGERDINFTRAFSDGDYTVSGLVSDSVNATQRPSSLVSYQFHIRIHAADGTLTNLRHSIICHGELA